MSSNLSHRPSHRDGNLSHRSSHRDGNLSHRPSHADVQYMKKDKEEQSSFPNNFWIPPPAPPPETKTSTEKKCRENTRTRLLLVMRKLKLTTTITTLPNPHSLMKCKLCCVNCKFDKQTNTNIYFSPFYPVVL